MEDWIQAIALLIFIVASGASSLLSNWREEQKKKKQNQDTSSIPEPIPSFDGPSRPVSKPRERKYSSPEPAPSPAPMDAEPEMPKRETLSDIFRELFEVELPKPVLMEPEEVKPKPRPRKPPKKSAQPPQPATPPRLEPVRLAHVETVAKPRRSVLEYYAKQAQTDPLRSAIILSEIIGPPVSLRKGNPARLS
ncbi:MAG: hypothetical protein RBU29_01680 [bacterium]|nr:hypothetical protein [bacterium]